MVSGATFRKLPKVSDKHSDAFNRWLALGILALLMVFNIALVSLKVASVPMRGLLAVGLLALLSLLHPQAASQAFAKQRLVLLLAAALAVLGIFVSLVNGTGLKDIFQAVLEVHIQIAVTVVLVTIVAQVAGVRSAVLVVVGMIGLNALLASLQFYGVDSVWQWRENLGTLQGQVMHEFSPFLNGRPMGLAYSPIQLATHLCLAFGAYAVLRDRERKLTTGASSADPGIIAALIILVIVSFMCATRSPILGAAMFLGIYAVWRRASWLLILMLTGGAIVLLAGTQIFEAFQAAQPRVMRVNDDSAVGRLSLVKFGLLLIRDNPLGYGFLFNPSDHWMKYWRELYGFQSSDDVQSKELHNYVLNMINTYGVGLVLVMPMAVALIRRSSRYLIYFLPYIMHILLHNSGPYWNDNVLWFVVGALSAALAGETVQPRRVSSGLVRRAQSTNMWTQLGSAAR